MPAIKDPTTYRIGEFDISRADLTRSIIAVGASGSGKSSVVKSILYQNRDIQGGLVFSSTEKASPFYSTFIPSLFIYDELDYAKIEDLFTVQEHRKSRLDKQLVEADRLEASGRASAAELLRTDVRNRRRAARRIIIIEDFGHKAGLMKHDLIRKVFMAGRHFSIAMILLVQYSIDIPIAIRGNAGFVVATREPNVMYRERLYRSFFGTVRTQASFDKIMEACCANYGVLIADNTARSMDPSQTVFWYRAPPPDKYPPFRMFSPQAWSYSEEHYDGDRNTRRSVRALKARMSASSGQAAPAGVIVERLKTAGGPGASDSRPRPRGRP